MQWEVQSDGVQEVEIVFGDRTEKRNFLTEDVIMESMES